MNVYKINDLFSSAELNILYAFINSIVIPIKDDGTYIYDTDNGWEDCTISKYLGRIQTSSEVPKEVCDKLSSIAKSISLKELTKTKEGTKYFNDLLAKGDFFKKTQFLISKLRAKELIEIELFSQDRRVEPRFEIFLKKPFYSGQELASIINRNL